MSNLLVIPITKEIRKCLIDREMSKGSVPCENEINKPKELNEISMTKAICADSESVQGSNSELDKSLFCNHEPNELSNNKIAISRIRFNTTCSLQSNSPEMKPSTM